jgi:hypothetical protein
VHRHTELIGLASSHGELDPVPARGKIPGKVSNIGRVGRLRLARFVDGSNDDLALPCRKVARPEP